MTTRANVRGIWDMRIGALLIVDTETDVDGVLSSRTSWQLLLAEKADLWRASTRRSAHARAERQARRLRSRVPTARNQALLYRLTGDINLSIRIPRSRRWRASIARSARTVHLRDRRAHGAQAFGRRRARTLQALDAKFSKVVMPGDTLIVRGYRLETPGQAAITVTVKESGEEAIANALFEYAP